VALPCRWERASVARTPAFRVRGSSLAKTSNRKEVCLPSRSGLSFDKSRGPQRRRSALRLLSDGPNCMPPPSPRRGRKIVAHGASRGRIGHPPRPSPVRGERKRGQRQRRNCIVLGLSNIHDSVKPPQGWVLSSLWGLRDFTRSRYLQRTHALSNDGNEQLPNRFNYGNYSFRLDWFA